MLTFVHPAVSSQDKQHHEYTDHGETVDHVALYVTCLFYCVALKPGHESPRSEGSKIKVQQLRASAWELMQLCVRLVYGKHGQRPPEGKISR